MSTCARGARIAEIKWRSRVHVGTVSLTYCTDLLSSLFLHVLPSNRANYTNFENLIDKKHHVDKKTPCRLQTLPLPFCAFGAKRQGWEKIFIGFIFSRI